MAEDKNKYRPLKKNNSEDGRNIILDMKMDDKGGITIKGPNHPLILMQLFGNALITISDKLAVMAGLTNENESQEEKRIITPGDLRGEGLIIRP